METKQLQAILKRLSPFNQMEHHAVSKLYDKIKLLSMQPKQFLFRQGVKDHNTFYLLSGSLIIDQGGKKVIVKAGTPTAQRPLFPGDPRKCSAISNEKCIILAINKELLDTALTWNQVADIEVSDVEGGVDHHDNTQNWMSLVLSSKAFLQVPPSNIQALLMLLEEKKHKAGDVIIKQGDKGDFFYVVRAGKCQVSRTVDGKKHNLATLKAGDSFGEEALLTNSNRNADVIMLTDGVIMQLKKEDFNRLLRAPLLKWVNKKEADSLVTESGAQWLDVRLESEYKEGGIDGSINIPLFMLRLKAETLDPNTKYILYCNTGRRSSAGAYLLGQDGKANVYCLQGGLEKVK